jgi:hypothetical protein
MAHQLLSVTVWVASDEDTNLKGTPMELVLHNRREFGRHRGGVRMQSDGGGII